MMVEDDDDASTTTATSTPAKERFSLKSSSSSSTPRKRSSAITPTPLLELNSTTNRHDDFAQDDALFTMENELEYAMNSPVDPDVIRALKASIAIEGLLQDPRGTDALDFEQVLRVPHERHVVQL